MTSWPTFPVLRPIEAECRTLDLDNHPLLCDECLKPFERADLICNRKEASVHCQDCYDTLRHEADSKEKLNSHKGFYRC